MRISIIVPVYNPPLGIFKETVASVLEQTDSEWELCICNDGSSNPQLLNYFEELLEDKRIKFVNTSLSEGISSASNQAVDISNGEYLAFLDHDDLLHKNAVKTIKKYILNKEPDFLYTDENKLGMDGKYYDFYYKPSFSIDHLRSVMYILHMMIIKKTVFKSLGGFRSFYDGAQDYDLALRVSEITSNICHIPEILYTWRVIPGSAAEVVDAKPWALEKGFEAIKDSMTRVGGWAEKGLLPGTFRARYPLNNEPISLIIFTCGKKKGELPLVINFLRSIREKSSYQNYKILVMNNGKLDLESRSYINSENTKIIDYIQDGDFNYAKAVNFSISLIDTELVILLNDDLEVISSDWIESLCELALQPGVGVVGAKLLYPNNTIQHCGVGVGFKPFHTKHLFWKLDYQKVGYQAFTHVVRNYSTVTGAVMATRLSLLKKLGGFDEKFKSDYNDADFCLRALQNGYRNTFTPFAVLYHFENSSFERRVTDPIGQEIFLKRWWSKFKIDPFFNKKINENE